MWKFISAQNIFVSHYRCLYIPRTEWVINKLATNNTFPCNCIHCHCKFEKKPVLKLFFCFKYSIWFEGLLKSLGRCNVLRYKFEKKLTIYNLLVNTYWPSTMTVHWPWVKCSCTRMHAKAISMPGESTTAILLVIYHWTILVDRRLITMHNQ